MARGFANPVYHAAGTRIHDLPIMLDKVMGIGRKSRI